MEDTLILLYLERFKIKALTIAYHYDDKAVGEYMRTLREPKISLRSFAKKLCLSPPYISDLENGKRAWSETLVLRYLKGLE